jgi:hypothetical protein
VRACVRTRVRVCKLRALVPCCGRTYLLFFETDTSVFPRLFHRLSNRFFALAHALCPAIPGGFEPARLNAKLYPVGSSLSAHVDNHDGWVLLFSLGCAANFFLKVRLRP